MKVLIANYYYPPLVDAHAYRWAQIASYWARQGHEVHVVTGKVAGEPTEVTEDGVRITRLGLISRPAKPDIPKPGLTGKANPRQRLMDFLRPIYRMLYWPDASWHWFPGLLKTLWARRLENYDLVVSYYPCMAGHLAVAVLKSRRQRSSFAWVADYGDPFSTSDTMQPNNYRLYRRINRAVERAILRLCTAMVLTNTATARAYAEALGGSDKFAVIPHLVDIERLYSDTPAGNGAGQDDSINLCFVGGFHKTIREPGRLFDLVRRLQQTPGKTVVLDIYGPLNTFRLSELTPADCPQIRYHGPVAREKAIALLKAADVIVNVDNNNRDMTPSKIVECISTGRPLLNIANPEVVYDPLRHYENAGYALSVVGPEFSADEVAKVRDFLNRCAKAPAASREAVHGAVGKHNLASVASQYERLVARETDRNGTDRD